MLSISDPCSLSWATEHVSLSKLSKYWNDLMTEIEVVLSLETRVRDILRVEGVAVPVWYQPVEALLPLGAVQRAGQVVAGIIRTGVKKEKFEIFSLLES